MLHLQIEKILKNRNITVTKARKKILKSFLTSNKPLDLKSLKKSAGKIDRVTLFRILSVFEKQNVIHTIHLENTEKLYALCNQECENEVHNHKHIHFQCEKCEDVRCLPVNDFPTLSIPSYLINSLNINATGVCSSCN